MSAQIDVLDWSIVKQGLEAWRAQLKAADRVAVSGAQAAIAGGTLEAAFVVGQVVRVDEEHQVLVQLGDRQICFAGARMEETTPIALLGGPRRALYPVTSQPLSAMEQPKDLGDYTVSVVDSPVRVELVGSKLYVVSPLYYWWRTWAKKHGGKWASGRKAWEFDVKDLHAVRERLNKDYGTDGQDERVRAVDVRLYLDVVKPTDQEWEILGRKVAAISLTGKPYTGDGVVLIAGELRNNKGEVGARAGTILEVRGVPLALALAFREIYECVGVELVKRGELDQELSDQGQRAAAALLSELAVTDLPELRRGRRAPTASARLQRAEDIGALDTHTRVAWQKLPPANEPALAQMYEALGHCWEELRELLLEQDGDWWEARAADLKTNGRDLCYYIEHWCCVALQLDDGLGHERELAPGLLRILAYWQATQLEQARRLHQAASTAPVEPGEKRPRPRHRKEVQGEIVPFEHLDSSPLQGAQVLHLREALGLSPARFGELLGCSRQRVYVWEREGTAKAHPSVSALLRLYVKQLPRES